MAISKLILCASTQRLIAGVWYGSRLQHYEIFENNDEGYAAFDAFVKNRQRMDTYLIADAIEEEYRLETLPHTVGAAKKEFLERKLNQFNRNNLFRAAHFIGQGKDKRREDNYLFVALSNADFMQAWLSIIQSNQLPLVGLYLLPMISQFIVQRMKLSAPHILLCEHLSSGLRQTYLSNGRLRMSRLASLNDVKPNQMAYFYLVEIEKTRLYLQSQRFVADHSDMQLVLPSSDENSDLIGKSISQEQGIECKVVNSLAFAKNSHIAPDLVAKLPELLHMQLLANGDIPDNLAPDQLTKTYRLNNTRMGIHIASAIMGCLGLILAGYNAWQGLNAIKQTQELEVQTLIEKQKYELAAKDFPNAPIPSDQLRIAVELADKIYAYKRYTPETVMVMLSQAIAQVPEIGIDRIRWLHTENPQIVDQDPMVASVISDASNNVSTSGNQQALQQVVFVNAEILGFGGDYRAALDSMNRFVRILESRAETQQVVVLQEPVNVSSFANLQGSTRDETSSQRTPAVFKLKLILKDIQNQQGSPS